MRSRRRQVIRSAKGAKCAARGTKRVLGESGALHGSRMIWKASINRNPTYSSGRPLRKMKMVQKWRRIERQGGLQSVGGGFEAFRAVRGWQRQVIRSAKEAKCAARGTRGYQVKVGLCMAAG